jgi:hypothetical protein
MDRHFSKAKSESECYTEPMQIRPTYQNWMKFTLSLAKVPIQFVMQVHKVIRILASCATNVKREQAAQIVGRALEKATQDGNNKLIK